MTDPEFTYASLSEQEEKGEILPEGGAWLLGYRRAMNWELYVKAYNHDAGAALIPPPHIENTLVSFFLSGVRQACDDRKIQE